MADFLGNLVFPESPSVNAILRSSDRVGFYIETFHLTSKSTFFETLFEQCTPDNKLGDLPVADVPETSGCVELLLSFCYPIEISVPHSLQTLIDVATAAHKYCLDAVLERMKDFLLGSGMIEKECLAAFVLAIHCEWQDVLDLAARCTLPIAEETFIYDNKDDELLAKINAAHLRRLLEYRKRCASAATTVLDGFRNSVSFFTVFLQPNFGNAHAHCRCSPVYVEFAGIFHRCIITYLDRLRTCMAATPHTPYLSDEQLTVQLISERYCQCDRSPPSLGDNLKMLADVKKITLEISKAIDEAISKVELNLKV